jgi:hypothetical protein
MYGTWMRETSFCIGKLSLVRLGALSKETFSSSLFIPEKGEKMANTPEHETLIKSPKNSTQSLKSLLLTLSLDFRVTLISFSFLKLVQVLIPLMTNNSPDTYVF